MKNNLFISLLNLLNVRYTKSYAYKLYKEHPYKYSLYGLSQMLHTYGIESAGIKVENKNDLSQFESPFIAQLGNNFVLVKKNTSKEIEYQWRDKNIKSAINIFNKSWTGVVLLAECNEKTCEPNYKEHQKALIVSDLETYLLVGLVTMLLLFMYTSKYLYIDIGLSVSLLLNIIGIYIGYLLVQKQLHIYNSYADKICTFLKKGDCSNVLDSSAAKFMGLISWSEVGLSYFTSNVLLILLIPSLYSYLAVINLCTLPYSLWSIWYQKVKARQWCGLCLAVQLLLWLLFISNVALGMLYLPDFRINNIFLIICLYTIPFLILTLTLPIIGRSRMTNIVAQEMNSFKMKDEVFVDLLKRMPYHKVDLSTSQIIFGNRNANIHITIFSNPHCNPCAYMHLKISRLLKDIGEKVCIQYMFTSFGKELDSSSQFMIAAYLNNTTEQTLKIYDEWFESGKMNRNTFIKKYTTSSNLTSAEEEYKKHRGWGEAENLHATPTIMINGYELPESYRIEDIKYFTDLAIDTK